MISPKPKVLCTTTPQAALLLTERLDGSAALLQPLCSGQERFYRQRAGRPEHLPLPAPGDLLTRWALQQGLCCLRGAGAKEVLDPPYLIAPRAAMEMPRASPFARAGCSIPVPTVL